MRKTADRDDYELRCKARCRMVVKSAGFAEALASGHEYVLKDWITKISQCDHPITALIKIRSRLSRFSDSHWKCMLCDVGAAE